MLYVYCLWRIAFLIFTSLFILFFILLSVEQCNSLTDHFFLIEEVQCGLILLDPQSLTWLGDKLTAVHAVSVLQRYSVHDNMRIGALRLK